MNTVASTTTGVQPIRCTICPIPNCAVCNPSTPNVCTECYPGYFPKDKTCTTKCAVEGCDSCRSNVDACDTCLEGWRKTLTGKCEKCTVSQCKKCDLAKDVCSECINDYVLEGEKCELCILGCKSCFGRSKCLECDENYNFWMDKSQTCHLVSNLLNLKFLLGLASAVFLNY